MSWSMVPQSTAPNFETSFGLALKLVPTGNGGLGKIINVYRATNAGDQNRYQIPSKSQRNSTLTKTQDF